jgi:ribosome-binding factor A
MRGNKHGAGPGHRGDRLAQQVREELTQIVGYELDDDRVGFATVTDVRVAPDYASARVYVQVSGTAEEQRRSVAALNHASGFIRRQLAPRLLTKRTMALHFVLDDLLDRGDRIESLLKENEG